ncbi:IS3 family transposase, partial [Paracoccaceae bacterium]|nr:IS3 family transposase [Paracoccaceae bacterium]
KLMRRIDELHMEYPFAGSRMMKGLLRQEGFAAGRLHVATCMKTMVIKVLYRRPNTSKPAPGHKIYPYLLRKLAVIRPNQVWAMDITYIPMARGFVYLVAVLDWFSRKVLAWRLSVTLETAPCLEALNEAMRRYGKPEIMTTDQGSQFTSIDFIKTLKDADIQISMDGKGLWRDDVFVERLWRSIKYEEVYLHAYDSVSAARSGIARYLTFYNTRRQHSSLDGQTPDQAYHIKPQPIPVAA